MIISFIYGQKARNAYVEGNREKAFAYYDLSLKWGAGVKSQVTYAYFLLKNGKYDRCEAVFEGLFKKRLKRKKDRLVKSNYALLLWKQGDIDGAIKLSEELFADYKTTHLYANLGFLYILKGDEKKALEFNKEAYEFNASNVIIDNLAWSYYLNGDIEKAIELYMQLYEKEPKFPEAYYNYGLILKEKNDLENAKKMFEKALEYEFSCLSNVTGEEVLDRLKSLEA